MPRHPPRLPVSGLGPTKPSGPGGQGPPFPAGSRGPLHVSDPRSGAPRCPAAPGWQGRGAGVGGRTRPGQRTWVGLASATCEDLGREVGALVRGGDPGGSCHLAAGTVFPAEQQQQGQEQQEEDEQGDEPPEGAGRAVWEGKRRRRRTAVPTPQPGLMGAPRPHRRPQAHPSACAPGRCCWAQGCRHPPRCSCSCSHRPRPGRSSTPPPPPLHTDGQ